SPAAVGLGLRRAGDHRGRDGACEVPGRCRAAAHRAAPAPPVAAADRPRLSPGLQTAPTSTRWGPSAVTQRSLLVATLVAGLAKQLAVLLLGHALASLLDDRTHRCLCTAGRCLRVCSGSGDARAADTARRNAAMHAVDAGRRSVLLRAGPTPRSTSHSTRRPCLLRRARVRDRSQSRRPWSAPSRPVRPPRAGPPPAPAP